MSSEKSYHNVRTVLYERDPDVRQTIKSTLNRDTFTQTLATSSLKSAQAAIFNDEADLIVVDIDNDGNEIHTMMRKIRHHEIGNNPFPVTIALSGNSSYRNVRQTIDSGFDLLLLKPFSMTTLLDRIGHLVRQRVPFAVTSDYIGPDRRLNARNSKPGDQKYQVIVPNPLKIMAEGKTPLHKMQRLIKESTFDVNETRIQRHGESIPDLVGNLVSNYMLDGLDDEFLEGLKKLNAICNDMDRRLKRSKFAHVAELCGSMHTVVAHILECPMSPEGRDIDLLQNLGSAIARAFQADGKEIATIHTITDSIKAVA
ncbi:MAG: response regulator [Proteobacteria bacterium]|nr:response regulator [Pseudomonadota bacterium]